ncbi:MAG: PilZ domain-containing protein, partial [Candidatus Omnitrophica bacterium]|nr:PilZ domain-containing protein [Candidatus Omnitrophota bacterium]
MSTTDYAGKEKREFFRYRHVGQANFKEVSKDSSALSEVAQAITKNLSASGMLFTSQYPPRLSSMIVLEIDYRTTRLCEEIEERVLILNNKLLSKVVRIEDNDNGSFDIGIAFVKKSENL